MSEARSFPPLVDASATVLILGSMPGTASLAAQQYYAHPRNAFWPIMGELFGARPEWEYARRVAALSRAGIAVWDVLDACVRSGSLDSNIRREGMMANDFRSLLAAHPRISRIYFNGAKAEQLFEDMVLPSLGNPGLLRRRLPSTSPAHAGMKFADKLASWRCIVDDAG